MRWLLAVLLSDIPLALRLAAGSVVVWLVAPLSEALPRGSGAAVARPERVRSISHAGVDLKGRPSIRRRLLALRLSGLSSVTRESATGRRSFSGARK